MAIHLPRTARPARTLSQATFWSAALCSLLFAYLALDNRFLRDFWQHLASARAAAEAGAWFSRADTLSFTIAGSPVINSDWLAQRLYLFLHRLGGLELVQALNACLLVGGFAVLTVAVRQRCRRSTAALAAMGVVGGCALQSLTLRPQSFSIVLACLVVWVLERSHRSAHERWWLVALMALWVNLHGAFPVGWLLILLDRSEGWLRSRQTEAPPTPVGRGMAAVARKPSIWRRTGWADLACLAAPLAHPQGVQILAHLLGNAARSSQRQIREWLAPSLGEPAGFFLLLAGMMTLWLWARARRVESGRPLAAVLVARALVLGIPAALSARMVVWFGIGMAAVWAEAMVRLWPAPAGAQRRVPAAALSVPILIAIAALPWLRPHAVWFPEQRRLAQWGGPVEAVSWLAQRGIRGRVWAPFDWAGYLEWELFGRVRLFADARVHLFPDPLWRDYLRIEAGAQEAESILKRWSVRWVLVDRRRSPRLERALADSEHWAHFYADDRARLFGVPSDQPEKARE